MRFSFNGYPKELSYTAVILATLLNTSTLIADTPETATLADMAPEVQAAAKLYQDCVSQQFSSMATAAQKRDSLQSQCARQRQALTDLYSDDLKSWVEGIIDARLEAVLTSLEQVESLVVDTVIDVQTSVDELAVLDAAVNTSTAN